MNNIGIIFSNVESESLYEITRKRTTGSIPFGGRYRLIDFALSDLVSANITSVAVLAERNYQSLMDHLGSGKDWDLSRRNGGLTIFPPLSSYKSAGLPTTRLDALKNIVGYINKQNCENVILMDTGNVNTIDLTEALNEHERNHADFTIVYKKMEVTEDLRNNLSIEVDSFSRITKGWLRSEVGKEANVSLNVWIIKKDILLGLIDDAISKGLTDLLSEVIYPNLTSLRVFGYKYQGIYMHISNMENYYKHNMELLKSKVRENLFELASHTIFTKVRDSVPTKYGENVEIVNSFIADGCEIEGKVINSILFRGVHVAAGSVVKDSILMQDTHVGTNVNLKCVITDKNVVITDRNTLAGCEKHPYYIGKNVRV